MAPWYRTPRDCNNQYYHYSYSSPYFSGDLSVSYWLWVVAKFLLGGKQTRVCVLSWPENSLEILIRSQNRTLTLRAFRDCWSGMRRYRVRTLPFLCRFFIEFVTFEFFTQFASRFFQWRTFYPWIASLKWNTLAISFQFQRQFWKSVRKLKRTAYLSIHRHSSQHSFCFHWLLIRALLIAFSLTTTLLKHYLSIINSFFNSVSFWMERHSNWLFNNKALN